VLVLIATVGKLGGTMLTARLTGVNWHDSFALGALMNTRGLVELIALNIGYDLGILSPRIFAMLVIMALVTTCMTGPLLNLGDYLRAKKSLVTRPV
jgi:Kef-type K+ transport system membrane component KefB